MASRLSRRRLLRSAAGTRNWPQQRQGAIAYAVAHLFIFIDRWELPFMLTLVSSALTTAALLFTHLLWSAMPVWLLLIPSGVCFLVGMATVVNVSRRHFLTGFANGVAITLNTAFIHFFISLIAL